VEDELANRQLVRAVLARSKDIRLSEADVFEAVTVSAGRQALLERPLDLVILDVRLPDGSGLELARELNQRRTSDALRVIIMSASVLPEDRDAAAAAGCDAFVAKPFHPAELVETIQRLVD